MALKYSSMLKLGTMLPEFKLVNALDNHLFASASLNNEKPSLLMLISNHCPYVIHYHQELQRLALDFGAQIDFVAIGSNDVSQYPQDGPEPMKDLFSKLGLKFPYLFDESQDLAKVLEAQCTPEFYLYDAQNALVYRGRLDDSSPGKDIEISGKDLRASLKHVIDGESITDAQHPSMGCSIKWK